MKKSVFVAINAKFIHSNLALRYMMGYYTKMEGVNNIELLEYSINQQLDYILNEIVLSEPEIVCFSCYLWNIEMVKKLSRALKQILPETTIVYGGPEVSYTASKELEDNKSVDYIIEGEGEETYRLLHLFLIGRENAKLPTRGIHYRNENGQVFSTPPSSGIDISLLPFPYDDNLSGLEHRILYYETSRGCPFNCQYCLSSIEKGVRFRSMDLVHQELQFFLDRRVRQVKLVDRTFNTRADHALAIMNYIIEHDNGVTNFHFEVAPELMGEAFLNCLAKAREGLFQLEIGVQSIHKETLRVIKRKNNLDQIKKAVDNVHQLKNTHMHLDLIAGLPEEDYETFAHSFDYVYDLHPDQLQLGFLKVLKGSGMVEIAEKYGMIYREYAPYEILKTNVLTFNELERLKTVEEMVELFYNSGQFRMTIKAYVEKFSSPFKAFEQLGDKWIAIGNHHRKHQKLDLYQFLYEHCGFDVKTMLMFDYCLNEKPRKKAEWMDYSLVESSLQRILLDGLEEHNMWVIESETYTRKQLSRMYHIDRVRGPLPEGLVKADNRIKLSVETEVRDKYLGTYIMVNYNRRDFIHNNGAPIIIEI